MAPPKPPKTRASKSKRKRARRFKLLFDADYSPRKLRETRSRHKVAWVWEIENLKKDREVFEYACDNNYILVIRDLSLKGKGREGFLKWIKEEEKGKNTGIIKLTPHITPKELDKKLVKFLSGKTEKDLYRKVSSLTT